MKKKLVRRIIFSKTPLKSAFQFEDKFQIFPFESKNAPDSDRASDLPLFIEFWIDENEHIKVSDELIDGKDFLSDFSRVQNPLNNLMRLLSSITNYRFSGITSQNRWGKLIPQSADPEEFKAFEDSPSQLFTDLYYYKNIHEDLKITKFSSTFYPEPDFLSHDFYYRYNPVENKNKEIDFPDTINNILSSYFLLDPIAKKLVDSVSHLICNGIDLHKTMKSLSFISLVSAIETLVHFDYHKVKNKEVTVCKECNTPITSPIVCKKCSRAVWGVNAKYREFLKTYISPTEGSVKKYKKIYDLRSKIAHQGILLLGDENIDWSDDGASESQTHLETMQLAKICLVNWLLKKETGYKSLI